MDRDRIQKVQERVELVDIYLHGNHVRREADFDYRTQLPDLQQQSRLALTADILMLEGKTNSPGNLLRVLVTFGVRFITGLESEKEQSDVEDGPKVLAEIEAIFCAMYHCSEEIPEDDLQEFLRFNVVHNTWPFWREHALRMAAEAKLPRPTIPLMKPANVA